MRVGEGTKPADGSTIGVCHPRARSARRKAVFGSKDELTFWEFSRQELNESSFDTFSAESPPSVLSFGQVLSARAGRHGSARADPGAGAGGTRRPCAGRVRQPPTRPHPHRARRKSRRHSLSTLGFGGQDRYWPGTLLSLEES